MDSLETNTDIKIKSQEGGLLGIPDASSIPGLGPIMEKVNSMQGAFENFKSQITGVSKSLLSVGGVITDARTKIATDVSGMVTAGIQSATQQAAATAKAATDEAIAKNPVTSGVMKPMGDGYSGYGGGGCKCRCKCNRKTRRNKKSKRSKSRVKKVRRSHRRS